MEITPEGILPLADKVKAIQKVERPKTVEQLKRFLGMTGFYHRFIEKFSDIATSLTNMTRNIDNKTSRLSSRILTWTTEAETAFLNLKQALQNCVKLAFPAPDAKLELATDASGRAAGAVLHQVVNGVKQPLSFFSQKFTNEEVRKNAFDRELLAIYLALKHFEDWLMFPNFQMLTDHKPLVRALQMKKPTPQQSRWLSYISEFNCTIHHIKGAENIVADTLSRSIRTISADFDADLAHSQVQDTALNDFFTTTSQKLIEQKVKNSTLICDRFLRPFVPKN